jgi:hypothetical protein
MIPALGIENTAVTLPFIMGIITDSNSLDALFKCDVFQTINTAFAVKDDAGLSLLAFFEGVIAVNRSNLFTLLPFSSRTRPLRAGAKRGISKIRGTV